MGFLFLDLDEFVERQLFGDLSPPHPQTDSTEVLESNRCH